MKKFEVLLELFLELGKAGQLLIPDQASLCKLLQRVQILQHGVQLFNLQQKSYFYNTNFEQIYQQGRLNAVSSMSLMGLNIDTVICLKNNGLCNQYHDNVIYSVIVFSQSLFFLSMMFAPLKALQAIMTSSSSLHQVFSPSFLLIFVQWSMFQIV